MNADTSGEGELHDETSLMHSRVKKIGQEAASVASKLQQTKEDLKTAQHRLAQMQAKQKQLSAKIQVRMIDKILCLPEFFCFLLASRVSRFHWWCKQNPFGVALPEG